MVRLRVGKSQNVEVTVEIEVVEEDYSQDHGYMVWACNLFDHGFNSSKEMQNHIRTEHNKVVNIEVTIDDQDKITEGVKTMMKMKEKGKVKLKKMKESALVHCVLTGLMEPKKQEALHKKY